MMSSEFRVQSSEFRVGPIKMFGLITSVVRNPKPETLNPEP